jgi:hypothetical protein
VHDQFYDGGDVSRYCYRYIATLTQVCFKSRDFPELLQDLVYDFNVCCMSWGYDGGVIRKL